MKTSDNITKIRKWKHVKTLKRYLKEKGLLSRFYANSYKFVTTVKMRRNIKGERESLSKYQWHRIVDGYLLYFTNTSLETAIDLAFVWADTPEGHRFWFMEHSILKYLVYDKASININPKKIVEYIEKEK